VLNHNAIRVAVAAMAVLISVAFNDDALGQPFATGDFTTYGQGSWGDDPTATNAAGILLARYFTVYGSTSGELEVGIPGASGASILFSNPNAVLAYLPALGLAASLLVDHSNPLATESRSFGGNVTALHLNVDFSDAGFTLGARGVQFGDLTIWGVPALPDNTTVRQFLALVDTLLGGGSSSYTIANLARISDDLNRSFEGGSVSQFAQDHLRVVVDMRGDFNQDGTVDAADYVVWRKSLQGLRATAAYYAMWRATFGNTTLSGAAQAAVPEPTAAALALVALLGLACHCRRSRC
jgi:hypothetical protein